MYLLLTSQKDYYASTPDQISPLHAEQSQPSKHIGEKKSKDTTYKPDPLSTQNTNTINYPINTQAALQQLKMELGSLLLKEQLSKSDIKTIETIIGALFRDPAFSRQDKINTAEELLSYVAGEPKKQTLLINSLLSFKPHELTDTFLNIIQESHNDELHNQTLLLLLTTYSESSTKNETSLPFYKKNIDAINNTLTSLQYSKNNLNLNNDMYRRTYYQFTDIEYVKEQLSFRLKINDNANIRTAVFDLSQLLVIRRSEQISMLKHIQSEFNSFPVYARNKILVQFLQLEQHEYEYLYPEARNIIQSILLNGGMQN